MADPAAYRASVVRTDPHSVEYDNGVVLPRDSFAHEDALAFEGQQAMPQAPMGGYGAGPMTADASRAPSTNADIFGAITGAPSVASDAGPALPGIGSRTDFAGGIADANAPGAPMVRAFDSPADRVQRAQEVAALPPSEASSALAPGPGYVPRAQGGGVPGGGGASVRSSTTTSTQRGVPVDPAIRGELNYQTAREEQARQDQAAVAGDTARQHAAYLGTMEQEQERLAAARAEREAKRQDAAKVAGDDYRRAVQDFEQHTVDPNRFYSDRGTGATITAAIAMGLGAFASSLTGQPNGALEIIQDAIGRDIDAQKANNQTAQAGVEARGNLLSQMRDRFDDERSAEIATEAALLRRAETRAQQLEAQAAASGAEAAGELASAQLGQRAAEREAELSGREADRVTVQTQTQRSSGGAGRRPAASIEIPGSRISDPDRAMAITAAERAKVADGVASMQAFDQSLRELEAIRRENGFEVLDRDVVARADAIRNRAIFNLSQTTNSGIINPGELARYEAMIPDATGAGIAIGEQLAAVRRATRDSANQALRARGYTIDIPEAEARPQTAGD